jgi:hypothetical protein
VFSSDLSAVSNQLPISVEYPKDPAQLQYTQELLYKRIASAVNTKEGGLYFPIEVSTFQQYFTPGNPQKLRGVYRTVVDFGALPNAVPKSVPHNIPFDSEYTATRIYACATDPVTLTYIPIPWASTAATSNNISIQVTGTTVDISTGIDRSNFTRCTVVIEYTKNL